MRGITVIYQRNVSYVCMSIYTGNLVEWKKKQQEILKEEHRGGTNEGEHHESIRESLERINGK